MTDINERVAVVETRVDALEHKMDEIKTDIRAANEDLKDQLKTMYDASCAQHAALSKELDDLKTFKNKWLVIVAIVGPFLAFIAAHINWTVLLNGPK